MIYEYGVWLDIRVSISSLLLWGKKIHYGYLLVIWVSPLKKCYLFGYLSFDIDVMWKKCSFWIFIDNMGITYEEILFMISMNMEFEFGWVFEFPFRVLCYEDKYFPKRIWNNRFFF